MSDERRLTERLADAQHEIWSHWMRWFFDNDTPENRERWKFQMVTPYADLTERERESDRKVVREFLGFLLAAPSDTHVHTLGCALLGPDEPCAPSDTSEGQEMPRTFRETAADALADACERAVRAGKIDARSEIGDALMDYRDERPAPTSEAGGEEKRDV